MESAKSLYSLNRGSVSSSTFEGFLGKECCNVADGGNQGKGCPKCYLEGLMEFQKKVFLGDGEFYLQPFASFIDAGWSRGFTPGYRQCLIQILTATWQTWIEINHVVAESKGIKGKGGTVEVANPNGGKSLPLPKPNPATPPGVLGIPIGQGHRRGERDSAGRGANVLSILDPAF
ncbi:MAG: hypothetical protein CM1200mP3_02580 [Chloroflexota bacterium]|nr:MAG: hypothetical protein CM1200mP3_02580 [Chloroflexota bacterium]